MPKKKFRITVEGRAYEVEVEYEESESEAENLRRILLGSELKEVPTSTEYVVSGKVITSPMSGRILSVQVERGFEVEKNSVVAVLEAMKTQIEVKAGRSGKVKNVIVKDGDVVREGEPILELG